MDGGHQGISYLYYKDLYKNYPATPVHVLSNGKYFGQKPVFLPPPPPPPGIEDVNFFPDFLFVFNNLSEFVPILIDLVDPHPLSPPLPPPPTLYPRPLPPAPTLGPPPKKKSYWK